MTMLCVASAFNGASTAIIPQVMHWMNDAPEVQGGVSACQFGCSWWWAHLLDVLRWRNWVLGLHLCWFKTTDKSHAASHSILTPRFEVKRIQWFSSQHLILLLWRKDWRNDREHGVLVYIALRVLVRIQDMLHPLHDALTLRMVMVKGEIVNLPHHEVDGTE